MQAWFNLLLAGMALGRVWVAAHDTRNGAAKPAAAAVRKNRRRDQTGGAEWSGDEVGEANEDALSFILTG